jgi:hypothetical protein
MQLESLISGPLRAMTQLHGPREHAWFEGDVVGELVDT